ncbi:hypothetical protein ACWGKW_22070 [Streptomyces sp. NPDC054766]|uniref:hypothetical protein n=1 Tax=Streptomyces rhizosphaerihabitans TaxID=1266770 RepID=UPI0021C1E2B1|nr:hypothetical protein [Streptomyces rhizosphaerihabitans]MCT9009121.1 hypothetical protein [Streptomyces rhizosphaerihabitans]
MTSPDFRPTHVVPQDGLPAWESPDPSRPTAPLDALLPVELVDRLGDWGRVVCANGWSAWVDGRLLIAVPQVPPAATRPLARTADPRPLLARVEDALTDYRKAAEELASGKLEAEAFRARTQGNRIGVVVDGESLWLYDGEHERWVYCDGTRLSTFAAERTPAIARPHGARPPREQDPQRDQDPERERDPERDHDRDLEREPEPRKAHEHEADPTRIVGEAAPGGHEPTRLVTFESDERGED